MQIRLREMMPSIITKEFEDWLEKIGYYFQPSSVGHHGNYTGGLYEHSYEVAKQLGYLTDKLELVWQRKDSPILVGMLHDICKCDDYIYFNDIEWGYNKEKIFEGHGDKSVMMLAGHIQLTEEEMYCIRFHMGAFTEKEEWKYYSKAVNKYPNVLYTHTADMIASQIKNV